MSFSTIIGSLGVAILLVAFFRNLFKFFPQDSITLPVAQYNRCLFSGYASYLIHFMPFVILEGTWCHSGCPGAV